MGKSNISARQQLQDWFVGQCGEPLVQEETKHLTECLRGLFGYHILQVGNFNDVDFLKESKISNKIIARLSKEEITSVKTDNDCGFYSEGENLPVASDSIDVVVLPHVLEFEKNPHQVLRESERILIGEGHVVIMGFNPISLWGLWRLFLAWREKPPWHGHYISLTRIKDWLKLLDFEMVNIKRFYFRPPLCKSNLLKRLEFVEQLGRYCWPWFGGVYLVVAKKRVVPLTPVKMQWRTRRKLIATGVAGTAAGMVSPKPK